MKYKCGFHILNLWNFFLLGKYQYFFHVEIIKHESYQHCFWELNRVFLAWSATTPLMQQMLVEEGLISGMIYELELFKDSPNSEVCNFNIHFMH